MPSGFFTMQELAKQVAREIKHGDAALARKRYAPSSYSRAMRTAEDVREAIEESMYVRDKRFDDLARETNIDRERLEEITRTGEGRACELMEIFRALQVRPVCLPAQIAEG